MQLNTAKRASFDEGSLDQYLRVINGYWLISRRYWSSDPSSNEARFAVFNCMAESPSRRARRRRTISTPEPTARTRGPRLQSMPHLADDRPEPVPANIGQPG